MDKMRQTIEKAWPLEESLILKDATDIFGAENALLINDTIGVAWDDNGYSLYNWQTDSPVECGKFALDAVVLAAIVAYVKYTVGEELGRYTEASLADEPTYVDARAEIAVWQAALVEARCRIDERAGRGCAKWRYYLNAQPRLT